MNLARIFPILILVRISMSSIVVHVSLLTCHMVAIVKGITHQWLQTIRIMRMRQGTFFIIQRISTIMLAYIIPTTIPNMGTIITRTIIPALQHITPATSVRITVNTHTVMAMPPMRITTGTGTTVRCMLADLTIMLQQENILVLHIRQLTMLAVRAALRERQEMRAQQVLVALVERLEQQVPVVQQRPHNHRVARVNAVEQAEEGVLL